MNTNYYAILMAGGVGSRFWPVSTEDFPKQFHDMLGTGETLIQKTFNRLAGIVPEENIFVLTNEKYNDLVLKQLPSVSRRQLVLEPAMRNTAPCILYASMKIRKENPDALIVVAPSDHWIENEQAFTSDLKKAFDFCEQHDALITLGIQPTFPNTGYGYVEFDKSGSGTIRGVKQFKEKPDYATAKSYIEKGNFLWNAGIFIWSAESVINAFEKNQPEMYQLFSKGLSVYNSDFEDDFISDNYEKAENISVDYAVMEKSDNVYILPATFDWNDLGTWGSLYDKLDKDENNNAIVNSKTHIVHASNNMIRSEKNKFIVIEGLSDFIIVDKDEVLLILPKEKEQEIKKIVQQLKDKFGEQYG